MTHKKSHHRFYPIPNFPGYFISKLGEVLCTNESLPVILDQYQNSAKDPYLQVTLSDNKAYSIHRLMAITFLSGPQKEHVNHIDGNKQNNAIDNLEWATPKENTHHAIALGLIDLSASNKAVHQYSLKGTYITSYISDVEAEKTTNILKQNISKCTLGIREHAGGYRWSRTKVDQLPPLAIKILKGALVLNTSTNESIFVPVQGQDFYTPLTTLTGVPKHTLQRRFDNNVAFIDNYRIEKIFFD